MFENVPRSHGGWATVEMMNYETYTAITIYWRNINATMFKTKPTHEALVVLCSDMLAKLSVLQMFTMNLT